LGKAATGVPQAIASTKARPNGSAHKEQETNTWPREKLSRELTVVQVPTMDDAPVEQWDHFGLVVGAVGDRTN
jgi:hypothetical protein